MVAEAIKRQIDNFEYRESRAFWCLFSIFILLFVAYGFLVEKTMINAVNNQNMSKVISASSDSVNSLEFKYLNLKNGIDMNLALSKGFVAVSDQKFISMSPSKDNLSLLVNENQ